VAAGFAGGAFGVAGAGVASAGAEAMAARMSFNADCNLVTLATAASTNGLRSVVP
jgi:hypothetical protein